MVNHVFKNLFHGPTATFAGQTSGTNFQMEDGVT